MCSRFELNFTQPASPWSLASPFSLPASIILSPASATQSCSVYNRFWLISCKKMYATLEVAVHELGQQDSPSDRTAVDIFSLKSTSTRKSTSTSTYFVLVLVVVLPSTRTQSYSYSYFSKVRGPGSYVLFSTSTSTIVA